MQGAQVLVTDPTSFVEELRDLYALLTHITDFTESATGALLASQQLHGVNVHFRWRVWVLMGADVVASGVGVSPRSALCSLCHSAVGDG
jgi:hypothetical protein